MDVDSMKGHRSQHMPTTIKLKIIGSFSCKLRTKDNQDDGSAGGGVEAVPFRVPSMMLGFVCDQQLVSIEHDRSGALQKHTPRRSHSASQPPAPAPQQQAHQSLCTDAVSFSVWAARMTAECCDEPGEVCRNGLVESCNAGCAAVCTARTTLQSLRPSYPSKIYMPSARQDTETARRACARCESHDAKG